MDVDVIKERLNCSTVYALKIILWADGNQDKIRRLIAQKSHELQNRKGIEEIV